MAGDNEFKVILVDETRAGQGAGGAPAGGGGQGGSGRGGGGGGGSPPGSPPPAGGGGFDPMRDARLQMEREQQALAMRQAIDQARRQIDADYARRMGQRDFNQGFAPVAQLMGQSGLGSFVNTMKLLSGGWSQQGTGPLGDMANWMSRALGGRGWGQAAQAAMAAPGAAAGPTAVATQASAGAGATAAAARGATAGMAASQGANVAGGMTAGAGALAGSGGASMAGAAAAGAGLEAAAGPIGLAVMAAQEIASGMAKAITQVGKFGQAIAAMNPDAMAQGFIDLAEQVPIVGQVFGALGHAAMGVVHALDETAKKYANYNPQIGIAQANAEARQIFGDMRRADQLAPEMSRFVELRSQVSDKAQDLMANVLESILPIVNSILEFVNEMLEMLKEFWAWIKPVYESIVDGINEGLKGIETIVNKLPGVDIHLGRIAKNTAKKEEPDEGWLWREFMRSGIQRPNPLTDRPNNAGSMLNIPGLANL